jgi:hypothetical protein
MHKKGSYVLLVMIITKIFYYVYSGCQGQMCQDRATAAIGRLHSPPQFHRGTRLSCVPSQTIFLSHLFQNQVS